MAKKRKVLKKKYQRRHGRNTKPVNSKWQLDAVEQDILSFIHRRKVGVTLHDIEGSVAHHRVGKKEAKDALMSLVKKNILQLRDKKKFILSPNGSIFSGKIEKNPRGFGFVIDLQPNKSSQTFRRDPFISNRNMATANHGDEVLIVVHRVRKDGRPEAEIVSVLKRNSERIAGYFHPGSPPRVTPEDPRYPSTVVIIEPFDEDITANDVVLVDILPEPSQHGTIQGKIVEHLGSPDNIDVQMRMVIEKHDLPQVFSDEVLAEASALSLWANGEDAKRVDLRDTCHFTIDGETAKDFDDAIAIESRKSGFRLYVSIADVSYFVKPGTAMDREAYLRGTSIYFPGRVIPMLPERLSNDLCSLVPDEDRFTFSAILDFDHSGKRIKKSFTRSVIRSRQRFTYTTIKKIVVDRQPDVRDQYSDFLPSLDMAEKLAKLLHSSRLQRGSIGFNIPEPLMTLNDDGTISSIKRKERNFAHQIIEEFMLAANEAVAEIFSNDSLPFLYRIHEKPDREKVEDFYKFTATLGLELPEPSGEPAWFGDVLQRVRTSPAEYVVNNLLLRTMQQARYSPDNCGHFGLAASDYTHFTSPIRRYPDLIVHRYLQSFLSKTKDPQEPSLAEQGQHLSTRERVAITAERDITERLKLFFMEHFIGNSFKAVISGVSDTLLFVELLELFVSGAMETSSLQGDYYLYDERRHWLIGEITGKTYQLGQELKVVLTDVDHHRRRIFFIPEDGG